MSMTVWFSHAGEINGVSVFRPTDEIPEAYLGDDELPPAENELRLCIEDAPNCLGFAIDGTPSQLRALLTSAGQAIDAVAPTTLDIARRWMNDDLRRFFDAELANEADGGVSPSTISSAIDSLSQAPDDVVTRWMANDPVRSLIALAQITDLVGTETELGDLL